MFTDKHTSDHDYNGDNNYGELVKTYFSLIRELRSGNAESVERILSLWDEEGTFEFAGSPPVTGTYKGMNALHSFYKNRVNSCEMLLRLAGNQDELEAAKEVALGIVDTEVVRLKMSDEKAIAGWQTVIGTQDGRGYQVAGSHTFTFRDGKISHLRIIVSPRVKETDELRLEDLSVNDIGRLALAAWAVV